MSSERTPNPAVAGSAPAAGVSISAATGSAVAGASATASMVPAGGTQASGVPASASGPAFPDQPPAVPRDPGLDDDVAIRVSGLSKCFQLYDSPGHLLKQLLVGRVARLVGRTPPQYFREFWALKGLDFTVRRGETVGIVGRNGAGKSTLLQILCGTLTPTDGHVEIRGRVAALLELGAGFNPEFSGRENVYLNGAILGVSREEIARRFADIEAFADIGEFIDRPVKSYSSGMYVRLAFAVSACIDPDVLIVDEALAVGDAKFQAKCFRRFEELVSRGTTILLVTHSTEQITRHCDRAILLEGGVVHQEGPPRDVANTYLDLLFGVQRRDKPGKGGKGSTTTGKGATAAGKSSGTASNGSGTASKGAIAAGTAVEGKSVDADGQDGAAGQDDAGADAASSDNNAALRRPDIEGDDDISGRIARAAARQPIRASELESAAPDAPGAQEQGGDGAQTGAGILSSHGEMQDDDAHNSKNTRQNSPLSLIPLASPSRFEDRPGYNTDEYRWGSREVEIADVMVTTNGHDHTVRLNTGEQVLVVVWVRFRVDVNAPIYGLTIKTPDGITVYGSNSRDFPDGPVMQPARAGQTVRVVFSLDLRIGAGDFLLSLGVAHEIGGGEVEPLDRRYDSMLLHVSRQSRCYGLADFDMRVDIQADA